VTRSGRLPAAERSSSEVPTAVLSFMAAGLAEDAGGHLEVDSAPGRGTRILLEVPA
jgi:hypothetical protein